MRGVIPRIATISDDCFLPRGCSFRMLPRSRLRHDPGWLFLGFRRGCRECLRRWRLHGDRRLRDRGSGRNDGSFHDRHWCGRRLWSDDCYRCGERLGGGNCDVLDRCLGLREPIEGNSESQIDAEPASDDCEEARKNRSPRLLIVGNLFSSRAATGYHHLVADTVRPVQWAGKHKTGPPVVSLPRM